MSHRLADPTTIAARLARITGETFVLLSFEDSPGHDPQRIHASLLHGDEEIAGLDLPLILSFEDRDEAQQVFTEMTREAVVAGRDAREPYLPTLSYVGRIGESPVLTTSNGEASFTGRNSLHVFENGALASRSVSEIA